MRGVKNTWAVIRAGGEGSRLREVTSTEAGEVIPKQFCSLQGNRRLFEDAIQRAQAVSAPARVCSVVADRHRRWWTEVLAGLPGENIFVQPKNRGTAHGILFALLPADHFVADEVPMAHALQATTALANDSPHLVYLLGVERDRPDPELGYIVPGARGGTAHGGAVAFEHLYRELNRSTGSARPDFRGIPAATLTSHTATDQLAPPDHDVGVKAKVRDFEVQ